MGWYPCNKVTVERFREGGALLGPWQFRVTYVDAIEGTVSQVFSDLASAFAFAQQHLSELSM